MICLKMISKGINNLYMDRSFTWMGNTWPLKDLLRLPCFNSFSLLNVKPCDSAADTTINKKVSVLMTKLM